MMSQENQEASVGNKLITYFDAVGLVVLNPSVVVGSTETRGLGLLVFASFVGFAVSTGLFVFEDAGFDVSTKVGTKDLTPTVLGAMVEGGNETVVDVGLLVSPLNGISEGSPLEDADGISDCWIEGI